MYLLVLEIFIPLVKTLRGDMVFLWQLVHEIRFLSAFHADLSDTF